MRVLIIGGTGHIGVFLTKMLAGDGDEITVVSTGRTRTDVGALRAVHLAKMDYRQALDDGTFIKLLKESNIEAVVDILQSHSALVYDACRKSGVAQLVACGSVWMFGRPKVVPTPEVVQGDNPFGSYRQRFAEMLEVMHRSKRDGFPFTGIMPPNICGPGKIPLEGAGGRSIEVHRAHQRGEEVVLPFPGTNLIGPCDAEDVARGFHGALRNRQAAAGEIFNVGSAYALTTEKFIATYSGIYGSRIPVRYVPAEIYTRDISPEIGAHFHFIEPMCPDISKISSRLGYKPKYTPEETMARAVGWMREKGML